MAGTLLKLDLAALAEIDDGAVNIAFVRELKNAARDILDRPNSTKKRTVRLALHAIGVADDQGYIRKVVFEAEVVPAKIPNYCTAPIAAKATMQGLEVDLNDPDGVSQHSMSEAVG